MVWYKVNNENEKGTKALGKRYTTSRYGGMEPNVKDESKSHFAAVRAALDARAVQTCFSLGLQEDGLQELALPLSESCKVTRSKGVKRQIPYTYLDKSEHAAEAFISTKNASYSVVCRGRMRSHSYSESTGSKPSEKKVST